MLSAHRKYLFTVLLLIVLLAFVGWIFNKRPAQEPVQNPTPPPPSIASSSSSTQTIQVSSTAGTKVYRNTEYGFEFQYPESWSFQVGSFYSPFSKFNLQGDSSAENYNPFSPSFIINIVTPDFADRAASSFKSLNASISIVVVAGVQGTKYAYEFENIPRIGIDIPFGKYRMLLGANRDHEDIFNKIIGSFKFFK